MLIVKNGIHVKVGEYPEYKSYDINLRECGLSYKPTEIQLHFDRKCFSNVYQNQTVLDTKGVILNSATSDRIYNGREAKYWESPWAVYLEYYFSKNESGKTIWYIVSCSGVLVTFQWVLSSAHCLRYENKL